jgi:hypothetical protein
MSDAFSEFYIPPDVSTTPAPDQSFTFGSPTSTSPVDVGTAGQYAGSFGGAQLPQAPAFNVQTQSAAPAQTFTPTDTGYTPTFDFSAYQNAVPSYGQATTQTSSPLYTLFNTSGQPFQAASPVYGAGTTAGLGAPANAFAGPGTTGYDVTNVPNIGGIPVPTARPTDLSQTASQNVPFTDTSDTGAPTEQPKTTADFLKSLGLSGGDVLKLLLGGAGGLLSYAAAQKTQQAAADAAAQYSAAANTAASQYQQLAAPLLTAGAPQLSMALQGNLGPAQLQQYEAQLARLAQAGARTGGAGAIQTAAAEQAMYQQALQNQQNMALQILGQADPILSTAIATELQGVQGGIDFELKYGAQSAQALGQMMASLAGGIGRTG